MEESFTMQRMIKLQSANRWLNWSGRFDFLHLSLLAALKFYKKCLVGKSGIVVNLMHIFSTTSEFSLSQGWLVLIPDEYLKVSEQFTKAVNTAEIFGMINRTIS